MKRLFVDIESTGLQPNKHQVLSVGLLLVDVDKDKLELVDKQEILIKHDDYVIQLAALKVNNIDLVEHDKNGRCVDVEEACRLIGVFMDKNSLHFEVFCGHNISFDINFLKSLFEPTETMYPFHYQSIDTMSLWFSLMNAGKIPNTRGSSLTKIADYFKVDRINAHSALEDCWITAKIYQKMLKEMEKDAKT